MKVLMFTGQLNDIMGEDARKNWTKECGLKFHNGHQNAEEGITLMEVVDEAKAVKYYDVAGVTVLSGTEANAVLSDKMDKVNYKKYDNELYAANIASKISKSELDIEVMLPEWTEQQELDYLYKLGTSGIEKKTTTSEKFIESVRKV